MKDKLKIRLDERADRSSEMDLLVEAAKSRTLSAQEKDRFYRLEKEINDLDEEIKPLHRQENEAKRRAQNKFNNTTMNEIEENGSNEIDFQIMKKAHTGKRTPITDFVRANKEISEDEDVSVWKVLPVLLGKKSKDKRVNEVASNIRALSGNANVLNDYLSGQILDGALPKSRLIQAGMRTIPMLSGTHRFGKIGTIPALEWKAELDSTTERTATLESVEFQAHTLRGWIQCSSEFLQDAVNGEEIIRRALTQAVAQGIDTAGLTGAGAPAPTGIFNTPGVASYTVGALDTFNDIVVGQRLIWEQDGNDASAVIMSPNVMAQYAALRGTNEKQSIMPPPLLPDLRFLQTSKLTGASTSDAVMGDFSSMVLGIRLEATIYISPTIAETYAHKFLIAFRGDIQVTRPEDFCLLEGISNNDLT